MLLSLKCFLLIVLIVVWQRVYLHRPEDVLFVLFCVLAYNATVYLDMRAGNVSLFEVALVWFAFWAYLRNRVVAFSVLLGTASLFRLTPLFFSLMLVFCSPRLRGLIALAAVIVSGTCGGLGGRCESFSKLLSPCAQYHGRTIAGRHRESLMLHADIFTRGHGMGVRTC